jgi:alpha-L-rhamnosidase
MNTPSHLAVEHLGASVLGLGDRRPRLSWRLPLGTQRQDAYALEIDGHALGPIASDDCILVPWPGDPLSSRQRVVWRVKVWADGTESEWSSPSWFETGLLEPADWQARFIAPAESDRSAHVLRHAFTLDAPPSQARLYATAHGVYETFLNSRRVGDVELAPGFTSYPTTLHG